MTTERDIHALNQARYGAVAQNYVQSPAHASPDDLERLVRLAQPQPDWLALDVATGGGHTARAFAPHVRKVVAYDLTHPMLCAARTDLITHGLVNVRFVQGQAEKLPFVDGAFDVVTCRLAVHHFAQVGQFFYEAARVLKAGGVLVVQDHLAPTHKRAAAYVDAFEMLRDPAHVRALPFYAWERYCQQAGLTLRAYETLFKQHHLETWARRQHCPPDIIDKLHILLLQAPEKARAYLQPQDEGTPRATFMTNNLFFVAEKPTT